jgi:hypothetical protein
MNDKARARVCVALGVVGLLGLAFAIAYLSVLRPRLMNRYALFAAVRPVHLANCTFERFGHPHDGGYLMCANLMDQAKVAYSYGIDDRDEWGCDVSSHYHVAVHEYDCFDTRHPVCDRGQFIFHAECIGPKAEVIEKRPFDSLTDQINRNGDHGKRLIVKMDVEGPAMVAFSVLGLRSPAGQSPAGEAGPGRVESKPKGSGQRHHQE